MKPTKGFKGERKRIKEYDGRSELVESTLHAFMELLHETLLYY
jgi:hypothetical protein